MVRNRFFCTLGIVPVLIIGAVVVSPRAQYVDVKINFGKPVERGSVQNKYFQVAQKYADALLEYGRDPIGKEAAMFVGILDIKAKAIPKEPAAFLKNDNSTAMVDPRNTDPNGHQDIYRLLYAMSYVTGETRYGTAADKALDWFFKRSESDNGPLAWGEGGGCKLGGGCSGSDGEHSDAIGVWDEMYRVNPDRMIRAAYGYWGHCVWDKEKGYYNRHCHGEGSTGHAEYPRHGGFYAKHLGEAFRRTWQEPLLNAINVLRGYFDGARLPSGLLPSAFGRKDSWARQDLSVVMHFWSVAPFIPPDDPRREALLKFATATDAGLVKVGWGGTSTSEGSNQPNQDFYSLQRHLRWAQLRDGGETALAEQYAQGLLEFADTYLPAGKEQSLSWAGSYGNAIEYLLFAFRHTGDAKYLEAAKRYADHAIATLFDLGEFPRTHKNTTLYSLEGMSSSLSTQVDKLPLALFLLGMELERPGVRLFVPSVRVD